MRVASISRSVAVAVSCFAEISSDKTFDDDSMSMAVSSSRMFPYKSTQLVEYSFLPYVMMRYGRHGKSGEVSCTECTNQGNVKMVARHPVERSFGSEFSAICNHCGVMAA